MKIASVGEYKVLLDDNSVNLDVLSSIVTCSICVTESDLISAGIFYIQSPLSLIKV